MPIILLFILILNIVSIVLMYYSLGDLGKKEKLIYIVVGTAVMYVLTSIVYWFSTRGIEVTEVSERGKDLITFLFVPINGIIMLPLLAKSYNKLKYGSLDKSVFLKRGIILAVILLIVLIIECMYFKNIQEQVVNMLNEQENSMQQESTNSVLNDIANEVTNQITSTNENETTNSISNVQSQNTQVTTNATDNVVESNIVNNSQGDSINVVQSDTAIDNVLESSNAIN